MNLLFRLKMFVLEFAPNDTIFRQKRVMLSVSEYERQSREATQRELLSLQQFMANNAKTVSSLV